MPDPKLVWQTYLELRGGAGGHSEFDNHDTVH